MTFLGLFAKLVSSAALASGEVLVSPALAWGLIAGVLTVTCAALFLLSRETKRDERPHEAMRKAA